MANWRLEIKDFFADMCVNALGSEIKYFGPWNSQKTNTDIEQSVNPMGILFEYSQIGDGFEYLLQRDMQQAQRVPVEVTLHIMFDAYTELYQNLAYDYADKLVCEIVGKKHELIHGRILKILEIEDTSHRAQYDYQLSFAFNIKEAIFIDNEFEDANPVDAIDPNPDTGRKIKVVLDKGLNT